MSHTDASFDPGTNATGMTIWRDGQKIFWTTIRPDTTAKTFDEKLLSIKRKVVNHLAGFGPLKIGAVEDFEKKHRRHDAEWSDKESMRKCGAIQGMLLSVCDDLCEEIRLVSKGKVKKEDTLRWAQMMKLVIIDENGRVWDAQVNNKRVSKDQLDSWEAGRAAGLDRKRS